MNLPDLRKSDLSGKTILVRVDFDVPINEETLEVEDDTRIQISLPTINALLAQEARVVLLSHLGRPGGKFDEKLSLKAVFERLQELLPHADLKFSTLEEGLPEEGKVILLENLRFYPGEENNDWNFAQQIASLGDYYINDAFAVSHREHASVVLLPKMLPHAAGLSLLKEVDVLSNLVENPRRPVVLILGGAKKDKLEILEKLLVWADQVLIGGKLPQLLEKEYGRKVVVASLNQTGKDITLESVEEFTKIISQAGTIVWAGPMGLYEEEDSACGTQRIGQMIVDSGAYTVLGGGDTEAALTKFNLVDKIDFVSSGGGACLEFLAEGDLPGICALREKYD